MLFRSWARDNPHLNLQADGTTGYFVSLAHGWSSGPAAWLMNEVLGAKASGPGFRAVQIRPELGGLKWVRGSIPTPLGPLFISADDDHIVVKIPPEMQTSLLLPAGAWTCNGVSIQGASAENGSRVRVVLHQKGRFEFVRH